MGVVAARNRNREEPDMTATAGHGRPTTYRKRRCRCDDCRANEAARRRRQREQVAASTRSSPRADARHGEDCEGRLSILCWCETSMLWLDPAEIRAGRTGTCGRPRCHDGYRSPVFSDALNEQFRIQPRKVA